MKDWEYWQNHYLDELIESKRKWFKMIEDQTMSPIESIACLYLRDYSDEFPPMQLEVKTQQKIGKYTVDLLVVDHSTNTQIVVECDGHEFHEKTKKQAAHDKTRDRFFVTKGFHVLRYTGSEICEDPFEIVSDVQDILIAALEKDIGLA